MSQDRVVAGGCPKVKDQAALSVVQMCWGVKPNLGINCQDSTIFTKALDLNYEAIFEKVIYVKK